MRNWFFNGMKWALGFVTVFCIIGLMIGTSVIIYQYFSYDPSPEQIDMVVRFHDEKDEICTDPTYPIYIGFKNNSKRVLNEVNFYIEARSFGRSHDRSDKQMRTSDLIITPGQQNGLCWQVPPLEGNPDPKELIWSGRISWSAFDARH